MAPLKIASLLALIAVASCRTPGGAKRVMNAEYIEEYEEALMSGELNEQYQATKDVEATQTSNSVEVRLHSSKAQVDLTVLDKRVVITGYDQSGLPKVTNYVAYEQYYDSLEWTVNTRGIHVIVLDRSTGRILNYKAFDTWGSITNSAALVTYLNSIPAGRVLCFAVLDEGSSNLDANARSTITALGSKLITSLGGRDMWTFVTVKGGQAIGEAIQKKLSTEDWARDLHLRVNVPLA